MSVEHASARFSIVKKLYALQLFLGALGSFSGGGPAARFALGAAARPSPLRTTAQGFSCAQLAASDVRHRDKSAARTAASKGMQET